MSKSFEPPTDPEERAEFEDILAKIAVITTNPALDEDDDEVFFQAVIPMLELGRTDAYKNHYRRVIAEPTWHTFVDKYGDRIEVVRPQITEWGAARLEQKWAEMRRAEQEQAEKA